MNRAPLTLTENRINVLVKGFLEDLGWVSVVALEGNATGVDVSGEHPRKRVTVEVESKGGTSGRLGSARFGIPFDSAQVSVHIAEAVLKALSYRERSPRNSVLIAMPDDDTHLSRIAPVEQTLRALGIGLLAVSERGVRVVYGAPGPSRPRWWRFLGHR